MGLFSNKKKPCPICGSATPRLLPDTIEGMPICKECAKKKDMPDQAAAPTTDPVTELQRYKALLDSGVITEEEFTAKKRQLMGI